jgi:hypothetical protein
VFKPLELLSKLKTEAIHVFAEHLIEGFLTIAKTDITILSKHPSRWATLVRVLSISATHPVASFCSFELTCLIISHPESPVTADHFGECVDLLLSFSAGVFNTSNPRPSLNAKISTTPTPKQQTETVNTPLLPPNR